ncbi:MAG TPA: hypothetical protein VFD26_05705 [Methyloceanibacter sp.]|nr:hypothetical protein [Methyloceanibacter sp.]
MFGQDNLSRVYSVDSSGSVSLPLIGPVRARVSPPSSSRPTSPPSFGTNTSRTRRSASRSRRTGRSSSWARSEGRGNIPMSTR